MPKEGRERSVSFERSRLSPFPCGSGCSRQSLTKDPLEDDENIKDWDDARCPVCMEHPHNAVLLMCSSHEKGCRPFMCDTSYRHSNCFDQFRKSSGEPSPVLQRPEDEENFSLPLSSVTAISESAVSDLEGERSPDRSTSVQVVPCENPMKAELVCPLCRGPIVGWTVVKNARHFMNGKSRSCACETCEFSGTYTDLRKHARLVHPLVRPTDSDPERQRNWRRLERQRDLGDLISTLQSSLGEERTEESTLTIDDGGWLTVFFLVRLVRRPANSSSGSGTSRSRTQVAVGGRSSRRLWGETIDGSSEPRVGNAEISESGQGLSRRYVRRRFRIPDDDNESSDDSGPEFVRNVRRRTDNADD